jgi:regulator of cell morphogenesis and NO signaling
MMMTATSSPQLDIRPLLPEGRHPRILQDLDSLAPGSDLVLISERDPRSHLHQLQTERGGSFDWSPLEEGPEVWRIRIHRRQGETAHREVSEYMAWDHDRLDAILVKAADSLAEGDMSGARRFFGEFRTGLLRHIRMEEDVLFPAFEQATGMVSGGPTAVMRMEHREIQRILEAMRAYLDAGEITASGFEALRQSLLGVLGEHNAKEEHVVYPMTDHRHTAEERDTIVRKMQAI